MERQRSGDANGKILRLRQVCCDLVEAIRTIEDIASGEEKEQGSELAEFYT